MSAELRKRMFDAVRAIGYTTARQTGEVIDAIEAVLAATPAQPTEVERDGARLDWLEAQINEHGAIHLHDGDHPSGHGLGLRPGALNRTLRQAIDAALSTEGGGNG